VKKLAVVLAIVLGALAALGVAADRVAASTAERTITERVSAELAGATDVSTQVHGVPILTQVARGSLDHVTVTAAELPASGLTLRDVVVDLYGVSTSSPRTATNVGASATLTTAQLQSKLGDGWKVTTDGDGLVATSAGLLSIEARVIPTVKAGRLALDLDWVKILGVQVDGSRVPAALTDRLDALVASIGDLPLGLALRSVEVTPGGVTVHATGSDVVLG
jgi:hypothetical protein